MPDPDNHTHKKSVTLIRIRFELFLPPLPRKSNYSPNFLHDLVAVTHDRLTSVKNNLAADHRHFSARLENFGLGNFQDVLREHGEIGQFAGFD
jgi:hypothetical protein